PARLHEVADGGLRSVLDVLGRPTAGPGALPLEQLPGQALVGGVLCLVLCALAVSGFRPVALTRMAAGATVLIAVAVGAVAAAGLIGRGFGTEAFRIAQLPVLTDLLLAGAVVTVVNRWTAGKPFRSPARARLYLPRARFALLGLTAVAVVLGFWTQATVDWQPATGTPAAATGRQR
ncbi:MAG TPA: hypothetical protein VGB74_21630, partial [Actinoplanes sp.]